jgi:catechol 2,3-dioxygenase-like lactoylglutathione lyase family enzyme
MSYVALATDRFDAVVHFYGEGLGLPVVERWDRPDARGLRFDLGGMRLEILDNGRKRCPLRLGEPCDRLQVVVEVDDIDLAWRQLQLEAPKPRATSWGARVFELHDPDGVPVTFLQWAEDGSKAS